MNGIVILGKKNILEREQFLNAFFFSVIFIFDGLFSSSRPLPNYEKNLFQLKMSIFTSIFTFTTFHAEKGKLATAWRMVEKPSTLYDLRILSIETLRSWV